MKRMVVLIGGLTLLVGCCKPLASLDSAALTLPFDSTVVVKGDDVTADFAIKELNEIVKKATGKTFECGVEATPPTVGSVASTERRCRIFVGRNAEVEKLLGKENLDKLGTEGSLVCAKGRDLFLVGSDPAGTLWAVYDFVEDNLGYRWYQECRDDKRAENEIVGTCDTVVFKGEATRRKPGFDGFRCDHENWGYFRLFRLRHRSNCEIEKFVPGYRFRYANRTSGHGFDLFLPRKAGLPWMKTKNYPEKVAALAPCFEKHPEWFSVDEKGKRSDKMQLCLSSKATRDAIWQSLLWWIEKNGKGVYMLGSNDEHTGIYCCCRDCLALDRKYGVGCGAMWECVIDICNRLKEAKMDGVYITSLAYRHQTQMAPLNCMFPDNFICDFAPVTWDRSLSEVKDETLKDGRIYNWLQNCRDWNAITPGGMSYWYYGSPFPAYTWGRMSKELGEIYDAGVRSAGYCGLEGGYAFEDLMHHMWFWCLYNPKGDARAEFGRACDAKYGPAADEILAYTDRLEALRQHVVKMTPCGPGALNILSFASKDELKELQKLFDAAFAKSKGSRYEQNILWARISLDVESFFKFGDKTAETRARAAAKSYCEKVYFPKLMRKVDVVIQRLDQMANYANLKSDELPMELRKYPKGTVSRVLPAKSGPYAPWGRVIDGKFWSVPEQGAVCGFAISDKLFDTYAPGGAKDIRIGLYDHNAGKYLIPFQQVKIPADFWEKDKYRLLRLGRSHYASRTVLVWTDAYGSTVHAYSPLNTQLLSRLFDTVYIDKEYETWISVKAQGPKFFPGDTRENRIFIEQLFSVDLK